MIKIINFSTLGAFTQYREVFYRVYVPPTEGGSKQRKPLIVATNFGPLAIVVANICSTLPRTEETSNEFLFNICLFVPITLSTSIKLQDENEFISLIECRNEELLRKLIVGDNISLVEKINEGFNNIMSWLKQQCFSKETTILIPYIENVFEIYSGEYKPYSICSLNAWELNIKVREVKIGKEDCINDDLIIRGILTAGLVPLTGSFRLNTVCGTISRAIFRDPGEEFIEDFYEASLCTYLSHLRSCLNITYEKLNVKDQDLIIIVDTTHGINNATTMMMEVIKESMPLIMYDTIKNNVKNLTFLFYNSDPVVPRENSLQITFENNISYYYTRTTPPSIKIVTNKLINRLLRDIIRNEDKANREENLLKILYNIYLITLGLIIWGAYGLERLESEINHDQYRCLDIIEISCKCYENSINVIYKVRNFKRNMFLILLTYWLYEHLKESIREFSDKAVIRGLNCWKKLIDSSNVRCYDIKIVKNLIYNPDCIKKSWKLRLLREIIDDSALEILEYGNRRMA